MGYDVKMLTLPRINIMKQGVPALLIICIQVLQV